MQCNQAFCGNPFTNGPFCCSYNTPLQSNQVVYPEIVGEGQVTSITLPDGSLQFFFMPTLKWRSANATQCHPFATTPNPMFANNNYCMPPQCNNNNNGGSWFIRSFLPFPQSMCIPPTLRNEFPKLDSTDFSNNTSSLDIEHKVKFHNDACSSTTDLVYFYPSLRQRDFVYTLPCKDKTVQIDTGPVANNTVCHYEVVCSKPCHCTCSAPPPAAPMSLDCLVGPRSTPKNNNMSADDGCCSKQINKRGRDKKRKQQKPRNIMWACDSKANIASVDKSVTTYADESCDCTPADGRQTQTRTDTKRMNKALLKPKWTAKCYSGDSTSDDYSCGNSAKKLKISQDDVEDKQMNKAPLKTKRLATRYSGDSMSVECSCDEVIKKSNNRSEDKPMNKTPLKSKRTAKSYSGDSLSVECSHVSLCKSPNNDGQETQSRRSDSDGHANAKCIDKALLEPEWTRKSKSGQSTSVECSCDDISYKSNNTSQDKPMHKPLLTPKRTANSESGQSMFDECSCDNISKRPNNKSQYNADATKPMNRALLKPKWVAKSYSGDSMTDDCSCDDASKKPKRRVNSKNYKRCKPKKCHCGCDSTTTVKSVTNKGGRGTPCTCSTCSCTCTSVLKTKYSPRNVVQKTSSVKSDSVRPACEEMRESPTCVWSKKVLDRSPSERLLDGSCPDCDNVASNCDAV